MEKGDSIAKQMECVQEQINGKLSDAFNSIEYYVKSLIKLRQLTEENIRPCSAGIPEEPKSKSQNTKIEKDLFDSSTSTITNSAISVESQTSQVSNSDSASASENLRISDSRPNSGSIDYRKSLQILNEHGTRILGEIAFQLDRRIVMHVFDNYLNKEGSPRRFYGYSCLNVDQMIEYEGNDEYIHKLSRRRNKVFSFLTRMTGFCKDIHCKATTEIINRYGLLKDRDSRTTRQLNALNRDALKSFVVRKSLPDEFLEMLTVLQSLCELSKKDSQPLFYW
ncbi:MAG: Speriolin C-terminus [Marteilia pararefringens]